MKLLLAALSKNQRNYSFWNKNNDSQTLCMGQHMGETRSKVLKLQVSNMQMKYQSLVNHFLGLSLFLNLLFIYLLPSYKKWNWSWCYELSERKKNRTCKKFEIDFTPWIFAQKWGRQNISLEKIYIALWMYTKAGEK